MRTFKKIIVTGDFLRVSSTGRFTQGGNIRWLYHLIRPSLELISGLPIEMVLESRGTNCPAERLYMSSSLPVAFSSWVSLFNKSPTHRDLAIIDDLFDDSLVISFELPEFLREALEELEIPYLDVTIHPVRFMDDLLFGVRSNIPALARFLDKYVVMDEEICVHAGLAMASLSRLPVLPACIGDGIALFAGQTSDDKVLIRDGRLLKSEQFMDAFQNLCKSHERVLVKPHPYSRENSSSLLLTRLFANTEVVDANFYHLLAHKGITHVYSITSSTSVEAAYFGKTGTHLSNYPYYFSEDTAAGGAYLTIRPDFFLPSFWLQVFDALNMPARRVRDFTLNPERSRMRRSLRNSWGADIFEFAP